MRSTVGFVRNIWGAGVTVNQFKSVSSVSVIAHKRLNCSRVVSRGGKAESSPLVDRSFLPPSRASCRWAIQRYIQWCRIMFLAALRCRPTCGHTFIATAALWASERRQPCVRVVRHTSTAGTSMLWGWRAMVCCWQRWGCRSRLANGCHRGTTALSFTLSVRLIRQKDPGEYDVNKVRH